MEQNLLKYLAFAKTAELGSFTKAADALNYTQSAISRMISDLETECGLSLLIRSKKGVQLTQNGQQLLPLVRNLCHEYEVLRSNIDELNGLQSGTIRIGAFSSVATHWIPPIIKKFQADYPGIEYELLMGNYAEIENWILEGKADCGFLPLPVHSRLETVPLEDDELMVILPSSHPMKDCEVFPVNKLADYPFILPKTGDVSDITPVFEEYSVCPNIRYSTFDDYSIMSMVENGLGISVLPSLILRRNPYDIVQKRLDVPAYRKLCIAIRKDASIPPAAKRFLSYLKYRK